MKMTFQFLNCANNFLIINYVCKQSKDKIFAWDGSNYNGYTDRYERI